MEEARSQGLGRLLSVALTLTLTTQAHLNVAEPKLFDAGLHPRDPLCEDLGGFRGEGVLVDLPGAGVVESECDEG